MSDLDVLASGTGRDAREARRTLKRRARTSGTFPDFGPLEEALDDLAARLTPGERKRLARGIAGPLRAANHRRINANVDPADEPMTPRKPEVINSKFVKERAAGKKRRRIRDGRMFLRAAGPRYLRQESSAGEAAVGFVGAMARIMTVHQLGLADTVTRDPDSPRVTYPARVVLGFSEEDRARILEQVAAQLG